MRQIQLHLPSRCVPAVRAEASACEGNALVLPTESGAHAFVVAELPNERVGAFINAVQQLLRDEDDARFTIMPLGVLPLVPPIDEVRGVVRSVTTRSSLELTLAALQSIGSWRGLVLYAVFSGIVAAYATIFNLSFLLVAAMLIAPMGAPAMVCATGSALGDARVFRAGLFRFWAAIAILAAAAIALGLAYGLDISTRLMELISSISAWTALVAIIGGAAGAQSLIQSDRDSLVTGTATGFLVAVALSPPSAVLGLSIVIGRWDYAAVMAFNLVLTFAGIVLGGTLVLWFFGVHPGSALVARGSGRVRTMLLGGAAAVLAGLVLLQHQLAPEFRKADRAYEAISLARTAAGAVPGVSVLEADARFTRRDLAGDAEALYVTVVASAERTEADELREQVRRVVAARIAERMPHVLPFVDITLVPPPARAH